MSKIKKLLKVISIVILLSSCATTKSLDFSNLENRDVIVFIPGYKGSRLVDAKSGDTAWVSAYQLLFGGSSMNLNSSNKLKANGILKKVEVIPYFYEIDVYEECFDSLKKLKKYKIVEFSYDWRRSNSISATKLKKFILDLKKNGAKSVSLIAHSMGGLSVAYALGYADDLGLDKVVFLGTVFRGTMIAFLDMNRSLDPLPFNSKLYTRKDFVSFDSAYEFLPHPDDSSFTDNSAPNEKTIYDVDNWLKYSWGVFKTGKKSQKKIERLKSNLERSKMFFNSFDYVTATCPNSKILNIQGGGEPVVEKYSFDDSKSGKFRRAESEVKVDGDSLISVTSSSLPKSLQVCPNKQIQLERLGHNKICNDKRVMKILKEHFGN